MGATRMVRGSENTMGRGGILRNSLCVCGILRNSVCLCPQIIKLKAEARLELLKQIGVSVDTWLKSAMNQVMEELENERWANLPSVTNNGSAHMVWIHPEGKTPPQGLLLT